MESLEEVSRGNEIHRVLDRGTTPLVKLVSTPNLPGLDHSQAGLVHTAFLFENQGSLAATVAHAAQNTNSRFVGSSDHVVSEAFYFTDPEGNGIELYVDRDRSQWLRTADGELRIGTVCLDPTAFLAEHLNEQTFAQANTLPGVVFASAGGYHHHVAMNTWNSHGAGPRAASLGLSDVAITVPVREDLDALVAGLTARTMDFADDGRSVCLCRSVGHAGDPGHRRQLDRSDPDAVSRMRLRLSGCSQQPSGCSQRPQPRTGRESPLPT